MQELIDFYRDHLRASMDARVAARALAYRRRADVIAAHPLGSTFEMLGSQFAVVAYGPVGSDLTFDVTVTYKNAAGEISSATWTSKQFPICEWAREASL